MDETDESIESRSISELLAIIARKNEHAVQTLVERGGGLASLATADAFEIAAHLDERELDGVVDEVERRRRPHRGSLRTARAIAASFELGRRALIARTKTPAKLTSPADVAAWAAPRIRDITHEELWVLALDGRGHLRGARCVARGGLHGAAVRAADPVRAALRLDATAFVLVHNHPSGDPTPSKEDVVLTAHVAAAAAIAHVPLLDHVVVARRGFECVPFPKESS